MPILQNPDTPPPVEGAAEEPQQQTQQPKVVPGRRPNPPEPEEPKRTKIIPGRRPFDTPWPTPPSDPEADRLSPFLRPYNVYNRPRVRAQLELQAREQYADRRIAEIEEATGQQLPTDMTLAMAESTIEQFDLARAARTIAREVNTPISAVFPRVAFPSGTTDRNIFYNPYTGKPISAAEGKRLYRAAEVQFWMAVIQHFRSDPALGSLPIETWAAAARKIAPYANEMPFDQYIGIIASVATTVPLVNMREFGKNLEILQGTTSLSEVERIAIAHQAAVAGIKFSTDPMSPYHPVRIFLADDPEALKAWNDTLKAQAEVIRRSGAAKRAATATDTGEFRLVGEVAKAGFISMDAPADIEAAVNLLLGKTDDQLTNYKLLAERIKAQYAQREAAWKTSLVGTAFGIIGQGFKTVSDAINAATYEAGSTAGALGTLLTSGIYNMTHPDAPITSEDIWNEFRERTMASHRMLLGDITLTEQLAKDGVNPVAAFLLELGVQVGFDPFAYMLSARTAAKAGKLISSTAEARQGRTWAEAVYDVLEKKQFWLKNKTLAEFLLDGAKNNKLEDFYDYIAGYLRSTVGTNGLSQEVTDVIWNWVSLNEKLGLGRSDAQLIDDINDILAYALTAKPIGKGKPQGLEKLLAQLRASKPYRGLGEVVTPAARLEWQPWMLNKEAAQVEKVLADFFEDIQLGRGRMMAIPEPGGFGRALRFGARRLIDDTGIGAKLRYLRSALPSLTATIEEDFAGWTRQYLYRARGLFSRSEIADMVKTAAEISRPGTPYREAKWIKFLMDTQVEMLQRIARSFNLDMEEIQHLTREYISNISRLNSHQFGVAPEVIEDLWGTASQIDLAKLRHPLLETQLPNRWIVMDPAKVRELVLEHIGFKQRIEQLVGEVLGVRFSPTVKEETVRRILKNAWIPVKDRFLRIFKGGTLANPRYVMRVVGDENIRFIADMGVTEWLRSRRVAAKVAERLGVRRPTVVFDVTDLDQVTRVADAAKAAGFENVDEAIMAIRLQELKIAEDARLAHLTPEADQILRSTAQIMDEIKDGTRAFPVRPNKEWVENFDPNVVSRARKVLRIDDYLTDGGDFLYAPSPDDVLNLLKRDPEAFSEFFGGFLKNLGLEAINNPEVDRLVVESFGTLTPAAVEGSGVSSMAGLLYDLLDNRVKLRSLMSYIKDPGGRRITQNMLESIMRWAKHDHILPRDATLADLSRWGDHSILYRIATALDNPERFERFYQIAQDVDPAAADFFRGLFDWHKALEDIGVDFLDEDFPAHLEEIVTDLMGAVDMEFMAQKIGPFLSELTTRASDLWSQWLKDYFGGTLDEYLQFNLRSAESLNKDAYKLYDHIFKNKPFYAERILNQFGEAYGWDEAGKRLQRLFQFLSYTNDIPQEELASRAMELVMDMRDFLAQASGPERAKVLAFFKGAGKRIDRLFSWWDEKVHGGVFHATPAIYDDETMRALANYTLDNWDQFRKDTFATVGRLALSEGKPEAMIPMLRLEEIEQNPLFRLKQWIDEGMPREEAINDWIDYVRRLHRQSKMAGNKIWQDVLHGLWGDNYGEDVLKLMQGDLGKQILRDEGLLLRGEKGEILGTYDRIDRTIRINGEAFRRERGLTTLGGRAVKDFNVNEVGFVVSHEYGHAVWENLDPRIKNSWFDFFRRQSSRLRRGNISSADMHASTWEVLHGKSMEANPQELFAEAYAIYRMPGDHYEGVELIREILGDDAARFFERYGVALDVHLERINPKVRFLLKEHPDGLKLRIVFPRAGEIADEAAVAVGHRYGTVGASEVFQSHEQALNSLLRRMAQKEEMNVRYWSTVEGDSPYYVQTLDHVLRNQVARSRLGRKILEGIVQGKDPQRIQREVEVFLANEGRDLARRLGLHKGELAGHAELLETNIRAWTQGDPHIARMALENNPNLAARLEQIPEDARTPVHGFGIDEQVGRPNPWAELWNTISHYIFEAPTTKLSRQPYFRVWKDQITRGIYRALEEQGITPDESMQRAIEAAARNFAIERTNKVMFDFRRASRMAELMGFVAPFYQAFEEALMVYGHLARKNAAFFERVRVMVNEMIENGVIRRDPDSGALIVPMSNWMFMAPLLNMAFGTAKGRGWVLSGPLAGMNFLFGAMFEVPTGALAGYVPVPTPSLNPLLMFFVQKIADSDMVPDVLKYSLVKWAYQYGSLQDRENLLLGVLPTWMEHLLRGTGWIDDKALRSQANDFLRLYQAQGITPQVYAQQHGISVAEAEKALAEKAMHQARQLAVWRAVMSVIFPVAPTIENPTESFGQEYRQLIAERGFDEGTKAFLEKYPDLWYITIPTTYWAKPDGKVPIPANQLADMILSAPGVEGFAKEFPQWIFVLLPKEVWEQKFDREVFFKQLEEGWRKVLTPRQFLQTADARQGWELWRDAHENWLATQEWLRAQGIDSNDPVWQRHQNQYNEYVNSIRVLYPGWGQDFDTYQRYNLDPWVELKVDQVLQSDLFRQTEVGKALLEYRDLRTRIMGELVQNNITSLKSGLAEKLGITEEYQKGVEEIIQRHPDFERAYNYFFRDDLQNVQTKADKILGSLTPEELEQQRQWSQRWESLIDQARGATTPGEAAIAYWNQRQMVDLAFQRYGDSLKNPMILWWETRTPWEQDQYRQAIAARPYQFLTRFDREVILKETVTDETETMWLKLGQIDVNIANEQDPAARRALYAYRDALAKQFAEQNPTFADQLEHANEWGYAFWNVYQFDKLPGREGEAWTALRETVQDAQRLVEHADLHGQNDFNAQSRLVYDMIRDKVIEHIEFLKTYSPGFAKRWNELERVNGSDYLIDLIFPSTWFRLGGVENG